MVWIVSTTSSRKLPLHVAMYMFYQILNCKSDILEVTDSNQQWDLSESSEEESSSSTDEPEEVETFVRSASSRKKFGAMKDPPDAKVGKKGVFSE